MKKLFLNITAILIFMLVSANPAIADDTEKLPHRIEYGIEAQHYGWKEFDDDNSKMVDESGYLYGLACDFDSQRETLGWRTGIDLFSGQVDYDGVTWSKVPVKTDVFYLGTQGYLDAVPNYRFKSGLWLKTFFGLGFKGWFRDLKDTSTQEGSFVNGAEEWWGAVYGRAGAGASYPLFETLEVFAEAGSKIPVYAVNHVNLSIAGDPSVDLEPELRFSPFAEAGVRWNRLAVKLSYDTLWFNKSDSVASSSGFYVLHQPKSESDIYKLTVTWAIYF